MGLTKPFAFLGTSGGPVFDPTLGGAISPAHWYDFTDSSTMTLNGNNKINIISSKGTLTPATLATGSNFKYQTASLASGFWIGPEYDSTNKYTIFSGSDDAIFGITKDTNSTLSRRYGTSPGYDLGFASGSQYTTVFFGSPDYDTYSGNNAQISISNKGNGSTGLPEEDNWLLIGNGAYAGNQTFTAESVANRINTAGRQRLRFSGNKYISMGYSGSAEVNGSVGPWQSIYGIMDGTDPSTGFTMKVTSTNTGSAFPPLDRDGTNSLHENLTVGSRSRTDVNAGGQFRVRHVLSYQTILTDQQIDDLNASYAAAYPDDNLNPTP
jgi:hypothetical protein